MRLWSLHPQYLDAKGLVALWREALLAKKVLQNATKGYKNHPQLIRFKQHPDPIEAINHYLKIVYEQSLVRGYSFDSSKFSLGNNKVNKIKVRLGQLQYEFSHLQNKLKTRDPKQFANLNSIKNPIAHPLFAVIEGEIEEWERV
jgi:hypothetical protein